jgi:hypothetical protein
VGTTVHHQDRPLLKFLLDQRFNDLGREFSNDQELLTLCDDVAAGRRGPKWQVINGLPMLEGKLFLPPASACLSTILETAHGMSHEGSEKTLHRLCANFAVPGARGFVKEFIRNYTTCQRNKGEQLHPVGLL